MLQRDTGWFPTIGFDFGDDFQMLSVARGELETLLASLRQRFPGVPVQEAAIVLKRMRRDGCSRHGARALLARTAAIVDVSRDDMTRECLASDPRAAMVR